MLLTDVNVLVAAYRADAPAHATCRSLIDDMVNGDLPYAVADLALSGFLRIVTHPRIFDPPTLLADALNFTRIYREPPTAVSVEPGSRHWHIFTDLCKIAGAKGNLVPDAYFAALAIESGHEWVTMDRCFGRFPGLKWRHISSD